MVLWPDTFTNHLSPSIAVAAVEVLEGAGFTVRIPEQELCCGLTWISTGQLGIAKKILHRTATALAPYTSAGTPVVGLEPSCTAVFRADAKDLFPEDRDVERLGAVTKTLGELLLERAPDWDPPKLDSADGAAKAIVQMHCHQHAILGEHAEVELMKRAGIDPDVLDSGCCGLAGNFGFEAGHYDVSMACAEDGLLPAVRSASEDTLMVADGFSCRTQVEQSGELKGSGAGRRPVHVAQLLATALPTGTRERRRLQDDERKLIMAMTVAGYLLSRLREWGVEHVFAFPGDGINGILAAWTDESLHAPAFIQSRHEEMSAFEAVGYAKYATSDPSDQGARTTTAPRLGVCMATSGPGAVHLLNGLYDAKLDHVPVVAIVGQTERSAIGGSYQQEIDLVTLFKDVTNDFVHMVTVPEQLPNVLDRSIRVAMANQAPTAIILPSDVQELEYTPPGHAFKQVPSSLGISWPSVTPDDAGVRRAADILNAGSKVALLVGQGGRGARAEIEQVAELLGAGAAKALLGKDVLPDDLPWVTGSIGLLGTRPSYEMMMGCDTLLTIGSNFPYTNFMPPLDQARGIQIDIDGRFIGMRYPYEVNLVGDAATTLRALLPHLRRKTDRGWREGIEEDVTRWWETMRMEAMVDADPSTRCGCSGSSTTGCRRTP